MVVAYAMVGDDLVEHLIHFAKIVRCVGETQSGDRPTGIPPILQAALDHQALWLTHRWSDGPLYPVSHRDCTAAFEGCLLFRSGA